MPDSPGNGHGRAPLVLTSAVTARDAASLLLIESLIHGLIARSILTVHEAIEIIDIAAEVERELYDARINSSEAFVSFLAPLSHSLQVDLPG